MGDVLLLYFVTLLMTLQVSYADNGTRQRFRLVPQSVLAAEGSSVTLLCEVDHQEGRAQWTKDGFALGFERHVPGYPRYIYTGDSDTGEHNLVITGVAIEDDGEYQCQVGPTDVAIPIWAAATVTVLVPPSGISIDGWPDDAVVELVQGSSIGLECLVTDSRPAPSISWYKDGLLLDSALQEDNEERGSKPRLVNLRSKLKVVVSASDHGQQYSCRGRHPALRDAKAALVSSVTLSVLHPPESITLTGWTKKDLGKAGDKVRLHCEVFGGNPAPTITWSRRGKAIKSLARVPRTTTVSTTTALHEKGIVEIRSDNESNSTLSQQNYLVESDIDLVLEAEDDHGLIECIANNDMLDISLAANITLAVMYAPRSVHITGPSSLTEKQSTDFTCTSALSNPPAILSWKINGNVIPTQEKNFVSKEPNGGWVTSLDLKNVKLGKFGNKDVIVECSAYSQELDKSTSSSHLVSIVKAPGPPLLANELRQTVPEGSIIPVICTSVGGNPPPSIVLSVAGQEVTSEVTNKKGATEARARVTARATDNEATILCEVSSVALTKVLTATARLNVAFSASRVSAVAEPIEVEEGKQSTLICETSSSNPPANITWKSVGRQLPSYSQKYSSGQHGGKITSSQMKLTLAAPDNGRVFSCTADNGVTPPVTVNVTTKVRHPPIWKERPHDIVEVQEGDDLLVTAEASANPGPIRYRWEHFGRVVSESGPELHISRITREEAGKYFVVASSPKGAVNSTFALDVLFPPEEIHTPKRITVGESGMANVECTARGNPKPNVYWALNNNTYTDEKLAEGVGSSRLVLDNVSRRHTGLYFCHAYNSLGSALPMFTALIITQPVEMATPLEDSEGGWAPLGGTGILICFARAAPRPTFVWTTEDGITLASPDKYVIHSTQLEDDLVLWSSRLEIRTVTPRDYGLYRCTAHNSLGAGMALYALNPPIPPPTPKNVTIIDMTKDSIVLTWSPGRLNNPPIYRTSVVTDPTETDRYSVDIPADRSHPNELGVEGGIQAVPRLPEAEFNIGLSPNSRIAASQTINIPEGYIVQYRSELTGKHEVIEIPPGGSPRATLPNLQPGVTYSFVVAAANDQGTSKPTQPLSFKMPDGSMRHELSFWRTPRLILLIISVTGAALLALNVAIIVCFLKKRARNANLSASSSKTTGMVVYPGTPASDDGNTCRELLVQQPNIRISESNAHSSVHINRSPQLPMKTNEEYRITESNSDTNHDFPPPPPELLASPCIESNSSGTSVNLITSDNTNNLNKLNSCHQDKGPDTHELSPAEICSLSGRNYCGDSKERQTTPCNTADDEISIASWHSFPTHNHQQDCTQYRGQMNVVQDGKDICHHSCHHELHHPRQRSASAMSNSHKSNMLHPMSFNKISFVPHQPTSLPEQGSEELDLIQNTTMRRLPEHSVHCAKNKRAVDMEMQNRPLGPYHHKHHIHNIQHIHHSPGGNNSNNVCSPLRHPGREFTPNSFRMAGPNNLDRNNAQSHTFRVNTQSPRMESAPVNAHGRTTNFSALSPADLCGYTSDTQNPVARCCQNAHFGHYGTLGPKGTHRADHAVDRQFSNTIHRSNIRPHLLQQGVPISPDISHSVTPNLRHAPRMMMRSFSVDDSYPPSDINKYSTSTNKTFSDYDNVSKYLFHDSSCEDRAKSRAKDSKHEFGDEMLNERDCQPFPTHLPKPSEPRVTFNEPIAETKTFHDPRLDDDDYDEDSNMSNFGNETTPVIYSNDVLRNNLNGSDVATRSQLNKDTGQKSLNRPNLLRSPPPPTAFRSNSSTSSNASSSPSSARGGMSAEREEEDTCSTSSLSSAATISLSNRSMPYKLSKNYSKPLHGSAKDDKLTVAADLKSAKTSPKSGVRKDGMTNSSPRNQNRLINTK